MTLDDRYHAFKHGFLLRVMTMGGILTAVFAFLDAFNLHELGVLQRNFNFFFSLVSIVSAVLLYKRIIKLSQAFALFFSFVFLGSLLAVVSVPEDQFRAIWFFLAIFFAFMLEGSFIGYLYTTASIVAMLAIQYFAFDTYNPLSLVTIIISMIFFAFSLSAFSHQMEKFRAQLRKQRQDLNYLASKDPLTGVLNSAEHSKRSKELLNEAKQQQGLLSMLCVHIDHLPEIYQKFGTQVEGLLHNHIERIIQHQLGSKAELAQVSEHEYCILLPGCDSIGAKVLAKQINESVQGHLFAHRENKIALTLSIGIASLTEQDNEIRSLQVRADKALMKAKNNGGNSVF